MQNSYKIAIVTLVVILVVVMAYYLQSGDQNRPQQAVGLTSQSEMERIAGGTDSTRGQSFSGTAATDMAGIARHQLSQAEAAADPTNPQPLKRETALPVPDGQGYATPSQTALGGQGGTMIFDVPSTQPSAAIDLAPTTEPASLFDPPTATLAAAGAHSGGIAGLDRTPRPEVVSVPAGRMEGGKYTVKSGDTFSSIAAAKLGSENRWHVIAQANPLVDPARLRVGMVIRLPDATTASQESNHDTLTSTAEASGGAVYVVREGDTLSSIARQYYGNSGKWEKIYNANRAAIGRDPGHVRAGMKLVIPPAPNAAK
jgi:nucleoid-associated protein YgaU